MSVSVDDTGDTGLKVGARKTVQAVSDQEAAEKLKHMRVEVQPVDRLQTTLACLRTAPTPPPSTSPSDGQSYVVNVVLPAGENQAVDLTLRIPSASFSSKVGPKVVLDVEAPLGNVDITGLPAAYYVRGGTGNITIKQATVDVDSDIETAQGNISFVGRVALPQSSQSKVGFHVGRGNLDITLQAGNPTVV